MRWIDHAYPLGTVAGSAAAVLADRLWAAIAVALVGLFVWDVQRAGGLAEWIGGFVKPARQWRAFFRQGNSTKKRDGGTS